MCVLGLNNVGTRRSCLRNTGQAQERVGEPVAGSRRYATVVSVEPVEPSSGSSTDETGWFSTCSASMWAD